MSTLTTTEEQVTGSESDGANSATGTSKPASAAKNKSPKREMTSEHKAAIQAGRIEAAAVGDYLEALEAHRPRPGRKQTPETLNAKLAEIDAALSVPTIKPINRLLLLQERHEVEQTLANLQEQPDMESIEAEFVKYAHSYAERKGIDYATWREFGVAADVLVRAGISRARG